MTPTATTNSTARSTSIMPPTAPLITAAPIAAPSNGGMHGADTELDKLTSSIEAEAEFLASHSHSARAVVDFVKKVDREIKMATNNTIDLKILFAAGIIAFTVFEVGATAATPVWVTLAIFTVNHFIEMHERQLHKESLSGAPSLVPIRVAN